MQILCEQILPNHCDKESEREGYLEDGDCLEEQVLLSQDTTEERLGCPLAVDRVILICFGV